MITKQDRELAMQTIERLNRLNHGSPKMVQLLTEVIEDVRTRAYAKGYSDGTTEKRSAGNG